MFTDIIALMNNTNVSVIIFNYFKRYNLISIPTTSKIASSVFFYNGLNFHRVEPGFVIQGGDPNGNGTGDFTDPKTGQKRTIPLETKSDLVHDTGALSMARSNDPNSASCQFYITLAPAHFLDGKYAVFGKVLEGQNVVDSIRIGDKITKVTEVVAK